MLSGKMTELTELGRALEEEHTSHLETATSANKLREEVPK